MTEGLRERLPTGLPSPPRAPERYEPIQPGSGRRRFRKRLGGALAPLVVLLAKAKSLLLLLPKLKQRVIARPIYADADEDGKPRFVGDVHGVRVRVVLALDEPDLVVTIHPRRHR